MSNRKQIELCQLIVDWLNGETQRQQLPEGEAFTAEYRRDGFVDAPKAEKTYVIVTAGARGNERLSRAQWVKQCEVTVSIVEKMNKRTEVGRNQRIDELNTLHEDIENLLLGVSFGEFDRNEEIGQTLPGAFGSEIYELSVFNADVPMQFEYSVKK